MEVPHEHAHRLVPADVHDLWQAQAVDVCILDQLADGLVPKIVKPQIRNLRAPNDAVPGIPDALRISTPNTAVTCRPPS